MRIKTEYIKFQKKFLGKSCAQKFVLCGTETEQEFQKNPKDFSDLAKSFRLLRFGKIFIYFVKKENEEIRARFGKPKLAKLCVKIKIR